MNKKYDDDAYLYFQEWLDVNKEKIKLEDLELVKRIFLEGFQQGRQYLNKYNWQLWNQK